MYEYSISEKDKKLAKHTALGTLGVLQSFLQAEEVAGFMNLISTHLTVVFAGGLLSVTSFYFVEFTETGRRLDERLQQTNPVILTASMIVALFIFIFILLKANIDSAYGVSGLFGWSVLIPVLSLIAYVWRW